MGFLYLQIQQFYFLSSTRVEECGQKDVQTQVHLLSCERERRDKGRIATVLDEKHDFW